MRKVNDCSLSDLETLFDGVSLEKVIDAIEAIKNNCRDSYYKDPRYSAFCGILKETESILQRTYKQST